MQVNVSTPFNTSGYCRKSTIMIAQTLNNIGSGGCSELGETEVNLIAEFAATFNTKGWAEKHEWTISWGCMKKNNIVYQDLTSIAEAHRAGADFVHIKLYTKGSLHATIWFRCSLWQMIEPPEFSLESHKDDSAILVVGALNAKMELEALYLKEYSNTSIRLVAEELSYGVKLKRLSIVDSPIDNETAVQIASALESGTILQSLRLSRCEIQNEGALSIVRSLKTSAKLKKLNLSDNDIDDDGVIQIAEAIEDVASLERLDLGLNRIGRTGIKNLKEAEKYTGILVDY